MDREGNCVGKMRTLKDCQPKCGEGRRTVGIKDKVMAAWAMGKVFGKKD